jgi:hypothetical protein
MGLKVAQATHMHFENPMIGVPKIGTVEDNTRPVPKSVKHILGL